MPNGFTLRFIYLFIFFTLRTPIFKIETVNSTILFFSHILDIENINLYAKLGIDSLLCFENKALK